MTSRFIAPREIRDESAEVNVGAGAQAKIVEIRLPAGSDGNITGFGQAFGTAGAFGSSILWTIEINGAGADQWTRFFLQRGSFTEPVNPQIYIPPGGRATVRVVNDTVAAVDARARLRVNVETKRGVPAGQIIQDQSGSGTSGGSSPPASGGGTTGGTSGGGGSTPSRPSGDGLGDTPPILIE